MTQDSTPKAQRSMRSVKIEANVLRPTYIDEIEETLAKSRLSLDDFDLIITKASSYKSTSGSTTDALANINSGKRIEGARVKIVCNFQEQYFLIADIYPNSFVIQSVPGEILTKENFEVTTWAHTLEAISSWVEYVFLEITRNPIYRNVAELTEEMEGILNIINELPDRYFTKDEGELILDRLNDLENRFKAYFEESEEEKASVRVQVRQLEEDMAFLRASLFNLTQKSWSRSFTNRLGRLLNSPAGQAVLSSGVSTAIRGLLEGPK